MRTFAAIFAVFLVQCTHLYFLAQARAEPEAEPFDFGVQSCVFGDFDVINVHLYNSKFPDGINLGNEQGCQYIDSSLPVVFITHGFTSSANETTFQDLAKAFVQKGHTAFILDWAEAACTYGLGYLKYTQYCYAAGNTRMIGGLMAKYTLDLTEKCNIPLKNIKYVGHSLGSHVCGFAAKSVKDSNKGTIPLIWALDPAFPAFADKNSENRVSMTDADRLIVMKTSCLGIWDPIGHLNLQYGDGLLQPACANEGGIPAQTNCSHSQSIVYATNIVKGNCQYRAVGTTWQNKESSEKSSEEGSDKSYGEKIVDFVNSIPIPKVLPGLDCLTDELMDKFLEAVKKTTTSPDATSKDCIALNIDTLKNDNTKGQYYVYTDCVKGTDINCEQK